MNDSWLNNTENLISFQFPIIDKEDETQHHHHHHGESNYTDNSIPTLFHFQKRRYSSVSVTGQPYISNNNPEDLGDETIKIPSTPPTITRARKLSMLNSPSPISPISGLVSSPLSPRSPNIVVSPLQIAIQQSMMMTQNLSPKDLHDLVVQILLEHEKIKKTNQEQIDTFQNQIEKREKSLTAHLEENHQLKAAVTGLNKDVQFLRLQSEQIHLEHENKIMEMKTKLERKERDLTKLLAISQRLEHENALLQRIQELLFGKVDTLVKQLEDRDVAISYLEEIGTIMRILIEEKNRELYEKTEHVYNRLCELCNQLTLLSNNGIVSSGGSTGAVVDGNDERKDFDKGIHSLRDELKKELNDCVSIMSSNSGPPRQRLLSSQSSPSLSLPTSSCEKRVQLIQNKFEELKLQSEEQEYILQQANAKLILELGKKMEEITNLHYASTHHSTNIVKHCHDDGDDDQ